MTDTLTQLTSALADRYTIERELGAGGMATVYLAHDLKHERQVAIKVLRPELAAVLGAERFLQEIKTTANLQHPNILALFDSGEADGFLYYVMPFIDGETLRDMLNRETQLGIEEAVKITTEVADALDYAHRHNVIHRDIKPENILLHDGRPMVADFGIALAVSAAAGNRMTETGLSLGTPHYMSPEQATAEKDLTNRSDIYSLGAVFYEMLTGDPPHTGSSAQQIILKIVTDDARPVTELRRSVPPNVAAATAKALEKLPADRFSSATELAEALTKPEFRHGVGLVTDFTARRGLWNWLSMVTAISAVLLAIAFAWVLLWSGPPSPVTRVSVHAPWGQTYGGNLAISPDGSMLVYGGQDLEDDRYRLWFRRWNSLDATPLEGSDGAIFPAFSPDGQEIAFNSHGGVRVVSAHGGEPRTLARGALAGTAWSEDGVWVYFADAFVGLKRVPADGGPVETVTVVDTAAGETGHFDPEVLPGDKALLFVAGTAEGYVIVVLDMETGEVRPLVSGTSPSFYPTGHLLFLDNEGTLHAAPFDVGQLALTGAAVPVIEGLAMANPPRGWHSISKTGTLAYVAGGVSDNLTPVWVARDGTAVEIDPDWRTTGLVYSVALSPNADRLAISVQASAAIRDLWVKQLDEGPLSRLTFEGSVNRRASWSSDGQSLTFISNRAGQSDLWTKRAGGSGSAEILLDREGAVSEAFFSSDGTWLIYREIGINSGISDIFAIQPGVDSVPIPIVVRSGFNAHSPALSPDGRWLVYVSDESGQEEVYVRPFPDADTGQWPVSRSGGTEPVWANSGRELFYRNGANELVAVQVIPGSAFAWDRQDVLFSVSAYETGNGHPLYDVSPDDDRFVMLRSFDEGPWELILVQNFFEELKRLVSN